MTTDTIQKEEASSLPWEDVPSPLTQVARDIMSFFPLATPRKLQEAVIKEIDRVFQEDEKRFIILEAPVGSGKSAMAMTFARAFEDSHVITPRKSLQDQYFEDFKDDVVLMKGRNAYPCTYGVTNSEYRKVYKKLMEGRILPPTRGEKNCSVGECKNSPSTFKRCCDNYGKCPYTVAMELAQEHHTVVHNIHSFVFQTRFTEKFSKRNLLIIDEAHDVPGIIRDFITKKFTVGKLIRAGDVPNCGTVEEWADFFLSGEFVPEETPADLRKKELDQTYQSPRDEYLTRVENLRAQAEYFNDGFVVKRREVYDGNRPDSTSFEFVPESIGNAASNLLFDYGEKVLLMSGTIYDKAMYCKEIGLNPEQVHFIRVPSTFPVKNRPVYLKQDYQVDTSHANWDANFEEMITKIRKVMGIFKDAKGLIHTPSYAASRQIQAALNDSRVVSHESHDFQEALEDFYVSKEPQVFLSPVCQQGVDFKGDRARFQIVLRVPYMNTSDEFVAHKVQNDFPWYNYQALIVFGQQCGRVNRSESDFGVTFLMDERFNKFIAKNAKKIPAWLKDAMIWR